MIMLWNRWCPVFPSYCWKLGSDNSPSNISGETSSALRVLPSRVKLFWVSAQGDHAGWASTEWGPSLTRLCWWGFTKKWFRFRDLVVSEEEDMLWHPTKLEIQDWFDLILQEFTEAENQNPKLTTDTWLARYIHDGPHEWFFCEFPVILYEWLA